MSGEMRGVAADRHTTQHASSAHTARAAVTPSAAALEACSDSDLLQRIADDDDAALRVLYARYSSLVYSLAWRMLGDQTRAEEVLQETFIRVWRAAITFDATRGRAEAWVVTIARNLALTTLRKSRDASMEDHPDEMAMLADGQDGPEQVAVSNDRRRIVQAAVAQLPENQRQVVVLAYFDGLTHIEIAERTGEPLGTVKSRLRLALRRLQGILRATLGETWNDIAHDSALDQM